MMKFMKVICKILERKGILSTFHGKLVAVPVNLWAVISFINGVSLSDEVLKALVLFNVIGWVWVTLPSVIKILLGKFEIEIRD